MFDSIVDVILQIWNGLIIGNCLVEIKNEPFLRNQSLQVYGAEVAVVVKGFCCIRTGGGRFLARVDAKSYRELSYH